MHIFYVSSKQMILFGQTLGRCNFSFDVSACPFILSSLLFDLLPQFVVQKEKIAETCIAINSKQTFLANILFPVKKNDFTSFSFEAEAFAAAFLKNFQLSILTADIQSRKYLSISRLISTTIEVERERAEQRERERVRDLLILQSNLAEISRPIQQSATAENDDRMMKLG